MEIGSIPPEILFKIFQELSFIDLLICTETCRVWNSLIKTEIFPKQSISLTAYSPDQFAFLKTILGSPSRSFCGGLHLQNLPALPSLDYYDGISLLKFENIGSIVEDDLINILNAYNHLCGLSLKGSDVNFTSIGLSKLKTLKRLVYLDLSGHTSLDDEVFREIVHKVPNLKSLLMDYCNIIGSPHGHIANLFITHNSILFACQVLPLKELSIVSGGINDEFMRNLGSLTKLERLNISKNSSVSLEGLHQFFKNTDSTLKSIDLSYCRRIFMDYDPSTWHYSINFLSILKDVNLSGLTICSKGFPTIIKKLKSAEKISLSGIDVPNALILKSLDDISTFSVTHLNLKEIFISKENAQSFAKYLRLKVLICGITSYDCLLNLCEMNARQSLEVLSLTCDSNDYIMELERLHSFPSLKVLCLDNCSLSLKSSNFLLSKLIELTLSDCNFDSINGIKEIFIHHTRLEALVLRRLKQINDDDIENILDALKYLKLFEVHDCVGVSRKRFMSLVDNGAKKLRVVQSFAY